MPILTRTSRSGSFCGIRFALRMRVPLAILTMAFAGIGLAANLAGVDLMLRPLGDGAATHPITAICMFALGFGALRLKRFGRRSIWRSASGAVIIAVCSTRLMEGSLTGATGAGGLDIFGPTGGFHGRFSIESAVALGAFAMADMMRQGLGRWGMMFLAVGLAMVFNKMLEISYGLVFFNGEVGGATFLGMLCAAFAMVTIYIQRPSIRVAFMKGDVGTQTRTMASAAVVIPWLGGLLLNAFGDGEARVTPLDAAVIAAVTWSMLVILFTTAARHEGSVATRRRAEREIAMQNRLDPLTGALNRFGMTEVVEGAWVDFKETGAQYGMVLIDLEFFRKMDQTFGTGDGEEVLARVAATIQPQLRAWDALGRWGTDEFLILLRIKEIGNIAVVADRLRRALADEANPFCAGLTMQPASMHIPLGVSDLRMEDEAPNDVIIRADSSLYISKVERGRHLNGERVAVASFDHEAFTNDDLAKDDLAEDQAAEVRTKAA